METPPIMLGYTRDPRLSHIQSLTTLETAINMELPIVESSYLSLYVTIEPQLLIPDAYRESVINFRFFKQNKFLNNSKVAFFSTTQLKVLNC